MQISGRALARTVDWPEAKVCLMETGKRPPSSVDVASYLAGCGPLRRPEYDDLVALAKEPDTGHWLRPHNPELPHELRSLIIAESMATAITSYEPLIIPGLLQTERYIRELFHWGSTRPADEIELRVRARVARQELLWQQHPPVCTFYIAEHALRTVVGDPSVMSEQILHLVLLSHEQCCSLRVVPDKAGPFGSIGGMFMLLAYPDDDTLAYTEGPAAGVFVEGSDDVSRYRALCGRLDTHALDATESRAWLTNLASAFDRADAESSRPPATKAS